MDRPLHIVVTLLLLGAIASGLYFIVFNKKSDQQVVVATPAAIPTVLPTAIISPTPVIRSTQTPEITNTPRPTPPPLDNSDAAFSIAVSSLENGSELSALLTDKEIIRKIVRAVHGLSEGRVVREFRPIKSPKGQFLAQKVGQQTADTKEELYRQARENASRYSQYVSLLALMNKQESIALYQFYLPTFERAFQELGLPDGSFHQSVLKAIDVLLAAPQGQSAALLTQPSVGFKFVDKALEKMSSAHKLMVRLGQENQEVVRLELQSLKKRLEKIK